MILTDLHSPEGQSSSFPLSSMTNYVLGQLSIAPDHSTNYDALLLKKKKVWLRRYWYRTVQICVV